MKIQNSPYKITDRTGATPNSVAQSSSVLDLESTTRGVLIPRMTTSQRNAIVVDANADGLIIYNIVTKRFEYYNTSLTSWSALSVTAGNFQTFNTTFYNPLLLQDVGFTNAGTITRITNNNGVFATVEYSTNAGVSYTALTFTANVWTGTISVSANSSLRFRVTFSGVNVQGTLTINEILS